MCAPNQPLTWIELTVAFIPSRFISATNAVDLRRIEVRELGVVDRDVGDSADAVVRQRRAGHLGNDARRDRAQAQRR